MVCWISKKKLSFEISEEDYSMQMSAWLLEDFGIDTFTIEDEDHLASLYARAIWLSKKRIKAAEEAKKH